MTSLQNSVCASEKPDVFKYLDYREFLKAYYGHRKYLNNAFSYEVFSRSTGVARSQLQRIINRESILVEAKIASVAKACQLNSWEHEYFTALVLWNQADDPTAKKMAWERLAKLAPKDHFYFFKHAEERILTRWSAVSILEVARLSDFQTDPSWIVERLGFKVSHDEVRESLDLLISLGFLEIQNGKAKVVNKTMIACPSEISRDLVRKYHRDNIPMGADSIEEVESALREICSAAFAIRRSDIAKFKEKVQSFRDEILEMMEDVTQPEEVYQLNVQLFPVTRPMKRGGSK